MLTMAHRAAFTEFIPTTKRETLGLKPGQLDSTGYQPDEQIQHVTLLYARKVIVILIMSASGWSEIKWPGSALVLWLFTYRPEREGNRLTWSTLFHWPEIFIPVWERWLSPVLLKFTYEWQTGVTRIRLKEKQFSWCFCVSFMWKKKGGNKKWNYFFSIYENMTSERWKHFVWVIYCTILSA